MPQNSQTRTGPSPELRSARQENPAGASPRPHAIYPAWSGFLIIAALAVLAYFIWLYLRRAAIRAWQSYSVEIGGTFTPKNSLSPGRVSGQVNGRLYALETAISHEDDAPYYHTCATVPMNNPAGLILGLRRKSLLEEAQTRNEPIPVPLQPFAEEQSDFSRRFFIVTNLPEQLPLLLSSEHCRELLRYGDIEVYLRRETAEWRRSGEVSELPVIRRLNSVLLEIADAVDALPKRDVTLSERMAEERLIEKGV